MNTMYLRSNVDTGSGGLVALRENLAANLKRLMRDNKLNQEKLAKAADLSQPAISGWITMRDWPAPESLERVAKVLGLKDPGALFRDHSVPPANTHDLLEAIKSIAETVGLEVKEKRAKPSRD